MELSFKRIGLLLEMERLTWGRTILILMAILTSSIVLFFEFNFGFLTLVGDPTPFDMTIVVGPILAIFSFFFLYVIHRRVNRSKGLPYTVIPASLVEKFISFILVGLVLYAAAMVVTQVCYLMELMLHPQVNWENIYWRNQQWVVRLGSFQLVDPLSHFLHIKSAVSALSFLSLIFFTAITFRRLRVGLGIYAAVFFGVFILSAAIAPLIPADFYQDVILFITDKYSPEEIDRIFTTVFIFYNLITGFIFGFFAYRNFKYKQL